MMLTYYESDYCYEEDGYGFEHPYVGLDGKPVERTRNEYPYSYSPYVVWKGDYNEGKSHTVYSDRLVQQNYNRFNTCCKMIWKNEGQTFDNRNPSDIEEFLIKYFDEDIKLTALMQGCNVSNGYPYWIFIFEYKEENAEEKK